MWAHVNKLARRAVPRKSVCPCACLPTLFIELPAASAQLVPGQMHVRVAKKRRMHVNHFCRVPFLKRFEIRSDQRGYITWRHGMEVVGTYCVPAATRILTLNMPVDYASHFRYYNNR
uniref:Uncharacterized protein n=1 Tax=Aegilops tauschii subsp. strangulata TaxID=200361 RepID=A0A453AE74_AEGTS